MMTHTFISRKVQTIPYSDDLSRYTQRKTFRLAYDVPFSGNILDVFGHYFADIKNNDANILEYILQ